MSASVISELSYGVSIVKDTPDQQVGLTFASDDASSTIAKVNGLAEKAGLSVGDRIISVNGISTSEKNGKEIASLIRVSSGEIEIKAETAAQSFRWRSIYSEIGKDIAILSEKLVYELAKLLYGLQNDVVDEVITVNGVKKKVNEQRSYTPLEIKTMIEDNIEVLSEKFKTFKDPTPIYQRLDELIEKSGNGWRPYTIEHYDKTYQSDEFVYLVTKDSVDKRIILTFRGTVTDKFLGTTRNNWLWNTHIWKKKVEVKDCLKGKLNGGDNVYLHSGFYNLFIKKTIDPTDGDTTKYQQVLSIIKPLLQQHPDYKLYVTGHSLGGALATICSFLLACEPDLNTPVTCVSYASPRVGDRNFLEAVQVLEQERKLRMMRVVNDKDLISTVPSIGYAHAGFEIRLYGDKDKEPLISYPNLSKGFWDYWLGVSWRNSMLANVNLEMDHTEAKNRLGSKVVKNFLVNYELNDLYADYEMVGYDLD